MRVSADNAMAVGRLLDRLGRVQNLVCESYAGGEWTLSGDGRSVDINLERIATIRRGLRSFHLPLVSNGVEVGEMRATPFPDSGFVVYRLCTRGLPTNVLDGAPAREFGWDLRGDGADEGADEGAASLEAAELYAMSAVGRRGSVERDALKAMAREKLDEAAASEER